MDYAALPEQMSVEHTNVLAAEPVVAPRVGETIVSVGGARRLLGLLAALRARSAKDAPGSRS